MEKSTNSGQVELEDYFHAQILNFTANYLLELNRLFLLLFLPWLPTTIHGQCQVNVNTDTIRGCAGDTMYFSATGGGSLLWKGYPTIQCDTCSSTSAIFQGNGYIWVESSNSVSQLAANGNFSQGNAGFTTQYFYNPTSIWNEGTYAVGPNPNAVHPNFGTWGDHTTGTGNYMLVNGSATISRNLWTQSIAFPPNVSVTMELWALTFVTPPGSIQLRVNGTNVGNNFSTPNISGVWQRRQRTFTSASNGNTNVTLRTISSAVAGNDFGLDDIRFSYSCTSRDTIWVESFPNPIIDVESTQSGVCDTVCVKWENLSSLDSTAANYYWDYGDGSGVDTSFNGSHCYTSAGSFEVFLYVESNRGCRDTALVDTVTLEATPFWSGQILPVADGGYWLDNVYVIPGLNPSIAVTSTFQNTSDVEEVFFEWGDGNVDVLGPYSGVDQVTANHDYSETNEPLEICITASNSSGCSSTICFPIAFTPYIHAPNVFTPNGDGVNDTYLPDFYGASRVKWTIFNRWGRKVYESNSTVEGWDGTVNGRDLPEGVYFMVAEAWGAFGGEPFVAKSTFHLMK